jgi:hypothetical protein
VYKYLYLYCVSKKKSVLVWGDGVADSY